MITKERFESGYTYAAYREMVDAKFAKGLTTGPIQTTELLDYTKLNIQRMHRLDKTFRVDTEVVERLNDVPCAFYWLLLTEAWCGDASQNAPIINKLAEASPNIHLSVFLRDENLDIIDQFLTNGGRAIPKLIVMDGDMHVIGSWGPRPAHAQQMVEGNKRSGAMTYSEFSPILHKWYAENKGHDLQQEILGMLETAGCLAKAAF
jgi:hypothetical protein